MTNKTCSSGYQIETRASLYRQAMDQKKSGRSENSFWIERLKNTLFRERVLSTYLGTSLYWCLKVEWPYIGKHDGIRLFSVFDLFLCVPVFCRSTKGWNCLLRASLPFFLIDFSRAGWSVCFLIIRNMSSKWRRYFYSLQGNERQTRVFIISVKPISVLFWKNNWMSYRIQTEKSNFQGKTGSVFLLFWVSWCSVYWYLHMKHTIILWKEAALQIHCVRQRSVQMFSSMFKACHGAAITEPPRKQKLLSGLYRKETTSCHFIRGKSAVLFSERSLFPLMFFTNKSVGRL